MLTDLAQLFDPVPKDLLAHFERLDGASSPPLLDAAAAVDLTRDFRGFHPVVRALDGVILDDEDTSDHHVYLARPPLAGMVLFLAHDGGTRVVFPSLETYRAAAGRARESGGWITDVHPAAAPLGPDQPALGALVTALLDRYDDDAGAVVTAVLPSLDLRDVQLLARLATHEDFYLGEAVADEITRRPRPDLAEAARLCASHPHGQVAEAGARAVRAVAAAR